MTLAILQPPWGYVGMVLEEKDVAAWLVNLREKLDLRQTDVDRKTRELGARVSQSYLSQIESGTRPFGDLGPNRMDALRRVYKVEPEEWMEKTGLSIMTPAPHPLSPAALGYRDIPKRTVEIPDALKEAAEQYGHMPMFSELRERRWQVFMADMPRKRTPSDVEGWLQDFARLKEMGIEPEES